MYKEIRNRHDKLEYVHYLESLNYPYKILTEPLFNEGDVDLNAYYWAGVVIPLAEYYGYESTKELHQELLEEFALLSIFKNENDETCYEVEDYSGMDNVRKYEYIEKIKSFFIREYSFSFPDKKGTFKERFNKSKIIVKKENKLFNFKNRKR